MSNVNTLHVVGNLVADPELRYTTSGRAVTTIRIGINDRIMVNGEWQSRPQFVNVVAWNAMAENVAVSVLKGDRVMVSGRLSTRTYEPEPGVKHYFTEIIADEIGVALRFASVGELEANEHPGAGTKPETSDTNSTEPLYGYDPEKVAF